MLLNPFYIGLLALFRGLSYFIRIFVSAELCYSTLLYLPWQEHSVKLILVIALLYLLVAIGMCMLHNQILLLLWCWSINWVFLA